MLAVTVLEDSVPFTYTTCLSFTINAFHARLICSLIQRNASFIQDQKGEISLLEPAVMKMSTDMRTAVTRGEGDFQEISQMKKKMSTYHMELLQGMQIAYEDKMIQKHGE